MSYGKWQEDLDRVSSWRNTTRRLFDEPATTEREVQWKELVRAQVEDTRELDDELHNLGIPFRGTELANVRAPYPEAVPILLKHLKQKHLPNVEEMIIRALSVPYGGDVVFDALLEHLHLSRTQMRNETLFALGNALAIVGNKRRVADLVEVASDEENGDARHQPLRMLAQLRNPAVEQIAESFFDKNYFPLVAIEALRRAKIWSAKEKVRPFLQSANAVIRSEARKYMKRAEPD